MITTARIFLTLGCAGLFTGVILGAFAAHALRAQLTTEMAAVWRTAELYQFVHALGLLAVGLLVLHFGAPPLLRAAGWLMVTGIVLFSGSLYALAITGTRWLGAIAPIGGLAFIVAWLLLALAVWRVAA
ncbi:MAG TPA: DUF423 domain-containing protein [Gammaproteobacteria bacterium]|jgi:uncharacterized membrane protein YgdD (TMEM256/DUF423 family)|nr:DUF423 domain-containing protein [Gammaproteobacteria bacterium]